ncbi:hypothetical protein PQX77_016938 [Marasmius sp. AFHP31]|nr:hypothetical protein PQX77_016938 [Marasmius sp. AFHP31]
MADASSDNLVLDPGNPRVNKIHVGTSPYDASYSDYVHALGPIFSVLMTQIQDMEEGHTREAHRKQFANLMVNNWLREWGDESARLETSGEKRGECKDLIAHIVMESSMSSYLSIKGLQPALDFETPWEGQLQTALEKSRFTQWKEPQFAQRLQPFTPTPLEDPAIEALKGLSWEEGCEKVMQECRVKPESQKEERKVEEVGRQGRGETWVHMYH